MRFLLFALCILSLTCCGKKSQRGNEKLISKKVFRLPDIPLALSNREQKAEFLAENYWANFNFGDTCQLRQKGFVEQVFSDYLGLLSFVSPTSAGKGLEKMMRMADVDARMHDYFMTLSEQYLYNPNSPVRNETLYLNVLKNILASGKVADDRKIHFRHRYELLMKNREGERAVNFCYTLNSGEQGMLYDIKAAYVLLFFNNPDCEDCKRVKQAIIKSQIINVLLKKGELKILSFYPDQDLTVWLKNYNGYPLSWINAYDKGTIVKNEELFDLKAIPTLYLLDRGKKVLMKDARIEEIEHYLKQLKRTE